MNKQALIALRDAVREDSLPEAVFHGTSIVRGHWAYTIGLSLGQRQEVFRAYNGSLDAAKALHEAVLPGGYWSLFPGTASVFMMDAHYYGNVHYGKNADPARAWLIAILEALIAEDTNDAD